MSGNLDHAHRQESAYNKALHIVREAAARGDTRVNLSSMRLAALTPEIIELKNLTKLDLRFNQLTALPPEIGELKKLRWLRLCGNQLTSLPPEIGQLANLKKFDVADNPLEDPPPEVVQQGTQAILKYLKPKESRLRGVLAVLVHNLLEEW